MLWIYSIAQIIPAFTKEELIQPMGKYTKITKWHFTQWRYGEFNFNQPILKQKLILSLK
jgi:hypothetical protein